MPPSRLSPVLRARTKTASSCWRGDAGNAPAWCIVSVAQPSLPVAVSGGIENCWNGIASARTSAPLTERPLHADTWKRTVISEVEREITGGETDWPSIRRRAGAGMLPTSSVPLPAARQPLTDTGDGGVEPFGSTTDVAFDVA